MQSTFVSKSILCTLIINVTLCRSAWFNTAFCNARCYWSHRGFDYGYYENGQCKCAPPTVYVFYGNEHYLSDESIKTSLDNDIIESPITKYQDKYERYGSRPATTNIVDKNNAKSLQMWNQIVETITKKYSFIKETDLESLKKKIIDDAPALRYFIMYLYKPLENALEDMKKLKPLASTECDELLTLLQQNKNGTENSKKLTPKPKAVAVVANQVTSPTREKPIATQKQTPVKPKELEVENVAEEKSKKNVKKNGNGPKQLASKDAKNDLKTSKEKKSQKIFVEMSEEYVDEDEDDDDVGHNTKKAKPAVKKVAHATTPMDDKEHEVNGSGSGYGSWTYEDKTVEDQND